MNAEERLAQLIQVGEDLAAAFNEDEDAFEFEVVNAELVEYGFPFDSFGL
jgi:hypothetical protein